MTTEHSAPSVPKWPFLLTDVSCLALAYWIVFRSQQALTWVDALAISICVIMGGVVCVLPFLWDHRASTRLAESGNLTTSLQQIQNIETVAAQIASATSQWQSALDQSGKTVTAAQEIGDRMAAEAKAFAEFMHKANDAEKGHLRLEVEKLRRSESQWLEVTVRMLDHVYGLYRAGVNSGQPNLVQQLGSFQAACRDVTRRIGLIPFAAGENEAFDAAKHQLLEENAEAPAGAIIIDTVATGFTFQGQMIRRAVVAIQATTAPEIVEAAPSITLTSPSTGTAIEQELL